MNRRTLAIAGSVAALSFAAAPVAASAASPHHSTKAKLVSRTDRSLDQRGTSHVDKSVDRISKADRSSAERRLDR